MFLVNIQKIVLQPNKGMKKKKKKGFSNCIKRNIPPSKLLTIPVLQTHFPVLQCCKINGEWEGGNEKERLGVNVRIEKIIQQKISFGIRCKSQVSAGCPIDG